MDPVSALNPCPACKKPDWCLIAPDGSACICSRIESAKRCGEAGWLHKLIETDSPNAERPKPSKSPNWQAQAERFSKNLSEKPKWRALLAKSLGLPVEALDAVPLLGYRNSGSDYVEFTSPETDAEGKIIGIATRTVTKGQKAEKRFVKGGKRGLTLPAAWRERTGPLFVVEGLTDLLAIFFAGLACIGRPSNSGGGKHLVEVFAVWPGEFIIVGENDQKPDGEWPGRDGAESLAKMLVDKFGKAVKWTMPPTEAKDVREWLTTPARGETPWSQRGEELASLLLANAKTVEASPANTGRVPPKGVRKIFIDTDEFRVNAEASQALASEPDLYERGRQLVKVHQQEEDSPAEDVIRRTVGALTVRPLSTALLRERLTRCAYWVQRRETNGKVTEVPQHPPGWAVNAVFDHGSWPVPKLEAIVTHPVFLPSGAILAQNGYDPVSGLFVSMSSAHEMNVPDNPTREDVARAVETIEDVLADFPFQTPAHKASWFAGFLTVLAWFSFDGPAPFFLIDGNVRGVGKGLLADMIALPVMGRRFPTMAFTNDRDELRKRITSLAAEGERAVLLDNLAGPVGNDVFDNALTSTSWKDRLLGGNKNYEGPLHLVWFATGNNVQLGADTSRRTCHIRLESPEEKPELKGGFRHPNLRAYARKMRWKILSAGLTILRGWHVAGRPTHNLPNWGSFEGWSGVVREAVVFAGLEDPGLTREELQRTADRDAASMETLIEGMQRLDPNRHGTTAAELIKRCQDGPEENGEVRGAIEELCGKLCGRKLGGRFKHFQRRNFGGKMLDKAGEDRTKTNRWAVYPVGPTAKSSPKEPASPASPADKPPDAGEAGNAGATSNEPVPAPAKTSKGRTYGNNPNRGRSEGGAK